MPKQIKNLSQSSVQNKDQKRSPKKEPLSLMTVKTLLAILLFTGMGVIIIGGGYIIGEYYKISNNQTNNKIWNSIHKCSEKHPESCDRSCNIDSDCIPSCTYNMGCIRSGEGQVGANAIRCEIAPFSCKCENNKCEIVEYEYKIKLLQSAEILGISLPIEIEKMLFYSDGGTTGIITKDANGKDFFFCLDGRMQETKTGEEPEPYHIYFKATHPTDTNAQKISISGEKEKAILNILQDWTNKQASNKEQTRLLNIRTVVGLSEEELKIYRILKVIKRLEDRNRIIDQSDTSDWQTYRNEELGFEVKYPREWTSISPNMIDNLVNFGVRSGSGVAVVAIVILDKKNIQEEINKRKLEMEAIDKNASITESEILVNNIKAKQVKLLYQSLGSFPESLEIFTYFNYGNNLYAIHLSSYKRTEQEAIDIYNSFLSTFKFIDQNTNIEDIIQGGKEIEYFADFKFENLPNYVFSEQKGVTYKLENYIFQFIRQPNLNTPLSISSSEIKYKGVLYSKDNGSSWSDLFVIDNPKDYKGNEVKYNPVGMFVKNNKLYLDISDDRGAGSGEGNLLRYYTEDGEIWTRDSCLYLIPELYFNGSDGIDPFTITGNSDCVYSTVSLCDDEPFGTAIGRDVYPIDSKYKKLHFLGQLFTAANCGQERLSQIFGVDGENYTLGSAINLKNNPSQELINVFKSIGFNCCDKVSDSECREWSHNNYSIKISELLKLEPYHNNFSSDDCVNCG